ncbi:Friend virus susceptibility protein 1-like [Theristicus caerulescens]
MPENQSVPVSVAPIQKKKYTRKSTHLVRADDEPGPSQEQEEEEAERTNEMVTTRSLSLSELRDMRKYFSRRPGEHIITWLLRCWDNGASSLELEGREAKQLGSLSREGGIDKAIGKGAKVLSLWRRLLSGVRERYPFKEDVICHPGKWTAMERGIQYLRELAVLEVIHNDLNNEQLSKDPDEVQCTRPMWRKFVRSAPSSYANPLAIMTWKDEEGPTVDELAGQLRQYEESLSSSLRPPTGSMHAGRLRGDQGAKSRNTDCMHADLQINNTGRLRRDKGAKSRGTDCTDCTYTGTFCACAWPYKRTAHMF